MAEPLTGAIPKSGDPAFGTFHQWAVNNNLIPEGGGRVDNKSLAFMHKVFVEETGRRDVAAAAAAPLPGMTEEEAATHASKLAKSDAEGRFKTLQGDQIAPGGPLYRGSNKTGIRAGIIAGQGKGVEGENAAGVQELYDFTVAMEQGEQGHSEPTRRAILLLQTTAKNVLNLNKQIGTMATLMDRAAEDNKPDMVEFYRGEIERLSGIRDNQQKMLDDIKNRISPSAQAGAPTGKNGAAQRGKCDPRKMVSVTLLKDLKDQSGKMHKARETLQVDECSAFGLADGGFATPTTPTGPPGDTIAGVNTPPIPDPGEPPIPPDIPPIPPTAGVPSLPGGETQTDLLQGPSPPGLATNRRRREDLQGNTTPRPVGGGFVTAAR